MARTLLVVPTGQRVGLTSVSLGFVRALERRGSRVAFAKPLAQLLPTREADHSTELVRALTALEPPAPIEGSKAGPLLSEGHDQILMEDIVARVGPLQREADIVVVEGLVPDESLVYSARINRLMAEALDADLLLVGASRGRSAADLVDDFEIVARAYEEKSLRVEGCILNKAHFDVDGGPEPDPDATGSLAGPAVLQPGDDQVLARGREIMRAAGLHYPLVGVVPFDPRLAAPRMSDVAREMHARVLREGQMSARRVQAIRIGAMTVPNLEPYIRANTLVVTPGDRTDVLMACSLASLSGTPVAGLLLTGGIEPPEPVMSLCKRAFESGLPVLLVDDHTSAALERLHDLEFSIPTDDTVRAEAMANTVASHLDQSWLDNLRSETREPRLSPPAFRHRLLEEARAEPQRIVLPEGHEPRTIAAAAVCEDRGIAHCVLLGREDRIANISADHGVELPDSVEILDPDVIRHRYVAPLVDLRRAKGMTPERAISELHDNVMLGTVMLALDEVDGLVSGAVHTTANTVRPAFQLIKTAPDARLVSSVFFMCLPDQVLVYGDCAINPDPTAEELADIAVQSADSASSFGIPARVALISYSTGDSAAGAEIEKVRNAVAFARERRPDLVLDGPLQYDAAINDTVARSKAPNSPVAGRATVLVFPDLNTGNTTYKAVQRSARVVSIGPMLQGLNKPVNDLSRGALVEDIIYTIALTAIQAQRRAAKSNADG
jgi:phosphate acetyltransferase